MTVEVVQTIALGVGAGVLSGLFGVGGGLLFVPALVLVGDLSQLEAAATSLAAMLPVAVVGPPYRLAADSCAGASPS